MQHNASNFVFILTEDHGTKAGLFNCISIKGG